MEHKEENGVAELHMLIVCCNWFVWFVDGGGTSAVPNHSHHGCLPSMHKDNQEPTGLTPSLDFLCTSQPDSSFLLVVLLSTVAMCSSPLQKPSVDLHCTEPWSFLLSKIPIYKIDQ